MTHNIGIEAENRANVAHELSKLLADEFVLYTKTRKAHWNVEGADFYAQHKFFEDQYTQLDDVMDDVAERIRAVGHYAPATLKEYLELTHLSEKAHGDNSSLSLINDLLADHESIIQFIRSNINRFANDWNDAGSGDFITGLIEVHEKMAWMLRTHLPK